MAKKNVLQYIIDHSALFNTFIAQQLANNPSTHLQILNGGQTPPSTSTYSLTGPAAAVTEGTTATFNLVTTGVADGTKVAYTIGGTVNGDDIDGGVLTGEVTVNGNTATIQVPVKADGVAEIPAETLTVTLDGKVAADGKPVEASVQVIDSVVGPVDQTLPVSAAGSITETAATNTTFNVTAGNYTYTIAGFAAGDKLAFATAGLATVNNTDFTDGIVQVQYAENGNTTVIELTGVPAATDAGIFGVTSFNAAFGAGSLV